MGDANDDVVHSARENMLVEDLLRNCHNLLHELEEFRTFLTQHKKEHTVEIRQFRNSVQSELKSLEKLSTADATSDRTIHTLRSSNLPFYTAVWAAAKRSSGLMAFNKRFYWDLDSSNKSKRNGQFRRRSALVDIVTQNGEEWVKVSTVTETRLLFEMAKAGWEYGDSSSDTDHADDDSSEVDSEDEGVTLVKLAEELKRASMAVRVRYRHPKVRFVLPKIREGQTPEIDEIIAEIRKTGATVQCHPHDHETPPTFQHLLPNPSSTFTPTLNIDCTILLALVSDLSHGHIKPEPWFHRAIVRQIEREAHDQLLPSSLWPALGSRALVCTAEAAKRMREIVDLIGTPAEKARTRLLMGDVDERGMTMTRAELVNAFRKLTEYEVPEEWNLPIRVVDKDDLSVNIDEGGRIENLPAVAEKVAERLTAINRSVFMYGWASGRTTISSNRTVAKLIEGVVEEYRESEDDKGPDVWLCATARSLVGKEKGRRD